jgi:hypothetical protein
MHKYVNNMDFKSILGFVLFSYKNNVYTLYSVQFLPYSQYFAKKFRILHCFSFNQSKNITAYAYNTVVYCPVFCYDTCNGNKHHSTGIVQ